MSSYDLRKARTVHLLLFLASIGSNDAFVTQDTVQRRSSCSAATRIPTQRCRSLEQLPSLRASAPFGTALFFLNRKGQNIQEKYTVYGKVNDKKSAKKKKKKNEPKIVEKYNIYGKRPPPPDDNVRPLLQVSKKQKKISTTENFFRSLDSDNDGMVSRKDFAGMSTFENRVFDFLDSDDDGLLSFEDFAALAALDTNKDGFIDKEEFAKVSNTKPLDEIAFIGKELEDIEETIEELGPLERQSFRMQGFDPYILVAVLTAGESFDVVTTYKPEWERLAEVTSLADLTLQDWYMQLLLIVGAASTLSGAYAAVTFSLTILYGKTAIGLGKDEAYYEFLDTTGLQRFRGFKAFSSSLGLFCLIVFLELVEKTPAVFRIPVGIAAAAFLVFCRYEYNFIIDSAGPIFAPTAEEYDDDDEM